MVFLRQYGQRRMHTSQSKIKVHPLVIMGKRNGRTSQGGPLAKCLLKRGNYPFGRTGRHYRLSRMLSSTKYVQKEGEGKLTDNEEDGYEGDTQEGADDANKPMVLEMIVWPETKKASQEGPPLEIRCILLYLRT